MKVIAKYILTFILAITLVNPVCCCSWGEFFAGNDEDQDGVITYSCCGSSDDVGVSDSDDDSPFPKDGKTSCNCATKKKFFETEFSDFTFTNTFPISFSEAKPLELAVHSVESKCYDKLIAYNNPPPLDTPKRILFSTYLL